MATPTMPSASPVDLKERLDPYLAIIGPLAMIFLILAFMGIAEPARYFRLSNFNIILLEAALYLPMAMAMTFVITQRGIDLSIGSVAALTGIIMAFLIKSYGFPTWIAVIMAVGIGSIFGLINGLVITKFRVPDLIGTLAMDLVYRGFALCPGEGSGARPLSGSHHRDRPRPALLVPAHPGDHRHCRLHPRLLPLEAHPFRPYSIAIGSNPEAAEMTGIAVDRHKIYAYMS